MTSVDELTKRVWREQPWSGFAVIRLPAGEQIACDIAALNAIEGAA